MSTVYVVGLGPGAEEQMTVRAQKVLEHCPVLIGYNVYIDLVKEHTDAERTGTLQNGI
jgi:precorrin-3B C17-methyltransferase